MPLLTIEELETLSPAFRGKAGNALGKGLMKMLSVDRVNDLYDRNMSLKGPAFARAVLDDLGIHPEVSFAEGFVLPEGPFITVSNHPCGHIDGVALVDVFARMRPDYKVMVNRMLSRVEALGDNFIPVTPTGSVRTAPTAASVRGVKAALAHIRAGGALGLFPSGAVSDLDIAAAVGLRKSSEPAVRDREWQEAVIRLVMKAGVPVVPVRFFDGNSRFYYSLGLIDWRVRLLRLLPEVFNKGGRPFRIGVGPVISVGEQPGSVDALRALLRSAVYGM